MRSASTGEAVSSTRNGRDSSFTKSFGLTKYLELTWRLDLPGSLGPVRCEVWRMVSTAQTPS